MTKNFDKFNEDLKISHTVNRQSEEDIKKTEDKLKKWREEAPDSIKHDEYRLDKQIIIEVQDRLMGPKGEEYKQELIKLNNKYPKINAKYGHDIFNKKS